MKTFIFSGLIAIIISGCANVKMLSLHEDEKYQLVIEDLNGSRDDLFTKANKWLITFSKNAEDVIEYRRDDLSVVIGKYDATPIKGISLSIRIEIRTNDNKAFIELLPLNEWNEKVVVDGYPKNFRKEDALEYLKTTGRAFEHFMKTPDTPF